MGCIMIKSKPRSVSLAPGFAACVVLLALVACVAADTSAQPSYKIDNHKNVDSCQFWVHDFAQGYCE